MARGQQKIQSQQKNAERQAKMKKAKSGDNKKSAQAALVIICPVGKISGSYNELFCYSWVHLDRLVKKIKKIEQLILIFASICEYMTKNRNKHKSTFLEFLNFFTSRFLRPGRMSLLVESQL